MANLTHKRQVFVNAYTDPTSDTFLSNQKSALKAAPNTKYPRQLGYLMKNTPVVASEIRRLLDEQGFAIDNRLHLLSEIGRGELVTEKEIVTKNGQVVTINVRPSVSERLNAIELANKLDGTYAQQQLDMDLAKEEAAELRRRLLREVNAL